MLNVLLNVYYCRFFLLVQQTIIFVSHETWALPSSIYTLDLTNEDQSLFVTKDCSFTVTSIYLLNLRVQEILQIICNWKECMLQVSRISLVYPRKIFYKCLSLPCVFGWHLCFFIADLKVATHFFLIIILSLNFSVLVPFDQSHSGIVSKYSLKYQ